MVYNSILAKYPHPYSDNGGDNGGARNFAKGIQPLKSR